MRTTVLLLLVLTTACAAATDASRATTSPSATTPSVGPLASVTQASTAASDATADAHPDAVRPEGFATAAATATAPDGTVCRLCVWVAETADQRSRGLMFVTVLDEPPAMAFVYPRPHTGTFWMKNTVLPLSIAFYDADGAYLDAFDMAPCTTSSCPSYPTPNDFTTAVEVEQGAFADVGLVPGSTLELLDLPCTP